MLIYITFYLKKEANNKWKKKLFSLKNLFLYIYIYVKILKNFAR